MRRLERGASFVPLIIVVVLLIVAVVWAYIKSDESDQLKMKLQQSETAFKALQTQRVDEFAYMNKLANELGWPVDPGSTDPKPEWIADANKIRQFKIDSQQTLYDTFVLDIPQKNYSVDDNGGIVEEESGEMIKVRYVKKSQIISDIKLERLFGTMNGAMARMLFDIKRYIDLLAREKEGRRADNVAKQDIINQKEATISQQRDDYNTLQTSAANRERELSDEINTLRDDKRLLENDLEAARKAHREEVAQLRNVLLGKEQDIVKLKDRKAIREEPVGPDGNVLSVTSGQDLVILDKGKDKHMMAGLTFTVYDFGKGAQKREKGTVVVLEVADHTARARVVELVSPMNPIVTGDYFESVTYNPEEELHFVLIGRFRKYGKSDAERRLTSLGAVVDSEVSIDTDFLVLGAPENEEENLRDSDAYKKAQELGIRILTEDQLSRFLLY